MHKILLLSALLSAFVTTPAWADLTIAKNVYYVDQTGNNQSNVLKRTVIKNTHNNHVYSVRAEVLKVSTTDAGQKLTPSKDITVFPPAFQLTPNQQQRLNIIVNTTDITDNAESEYRIRFHPALINSKKGDFNVITTMGALVFVAPTEITGDVAFQRTNNSVVLKNNHNVNVSLRQNKQCAQGVDCTIEGVRLRPGQVWKINLPQALQNKPLTLEKSIYGISETLEVK